MNSNQDEPLMTAKEVMIYLKISRSTLYRLVNSGHLRGYKVGSTWRFAPADIRDLLGENNTRRVGTST